MESNWCLALCGRVGIPDESPGEAIGIGATHLQWRSQYLGDAVPWDNNQWQQQLWSRAGLTLAVCAAEVVLLPKSFRVQKSRSWYQISNTELLISLNSALFWFECNYADGLVCIRKQCCSMASASVSASSSYSCIPQWWRLDVYLQA